MQRNCIRPVLLETLCETGRLRGICYRSTNWIWVGEARGRGKLDARKECTLPVRVIPVKPVHPTWRSILSR